MYKLYWGRRTGAFVVDAAFAEAGVEAERIEVRRVDGRTDDPDFEAVNPMKQIPALVLPSGTVLTESAAIALALADLLPAAELLPAPGTDARAVACRWLLHMAVNIYECNLRYTYPDRYTTDPGGSDGVRDAAIGRWDRAFGVVEAGIAGGPWFLGDTFSLLDPYLAMLVCWHHDPPALLGRSPHIATVCRGVRGRPRLGPVFERYRMPELDAMT